MEERLMLAHTKKRINEIIASVEQAYAESQKDNEIQSIIKVNDTFKMSRHDALQKEIYNGNYILKISSELAKPIQI